MRVIGNTLASRPLPEFVHGDADRMIERLDPGEELAGHRDIRSQGSNLRTHRHCIEQDTHSEKMFALLN
jgi:hypothetical protein